jgi:protein TonB
MKTHPKDVRTNERARASAPSMTQEGIERLIQRNPGRGAYRLRFMSALAVSMSLVIGMMVAPIGAGEDDEIALFTEQAVVEMEEIEQTRQEVKPPPPPRPPVPIEVPNEVELEDVALDLDATLDLDEAVASLPPPPPPPTEEAPQEEVEPEIFVVVEQMPSIKGGTARLYELVEYPEIARQAGMEGLVVIQVIVEPNGKGSNPVVARSAGQALDEAALAAVEKLEFEPGRQRGTAVRVKYAVPVRFRLRGGQS